MRRIVFLLAAVGAACFCGSAGAETVWLCHPGEKPNPCTRSLAFTAVQSDLSAKVFRVDAKRAQPIDCFYVYPSVSTERRGNSDLVPGIEEEDTAQLQASWFSPICRVFAPMYRQVTTNGDGEPFKSNRKWEYDDVLAAWRAYLAKDNKGRGFVFIGHSRGTYLLKRLIREQVEPNAKLRRQLVSAVLLGGGVVVKNGSTTGGDFKRLPACTSATQVGCVVAFSTWDKAPPANASFQNVGNKAREHILCVNPAAPGGGAADVTPLFLKTTFNEMGGVSPALLFAIDTDWVSYPGKYRARCVQRGSMAWLQVESVARNDKRPKAILLNGNRWGLHNLDANLALYELVGLVGSQATAYARR